jgi:glucosylceramidase
MKLQQYFFIFKTLVYGLVASALIQCKTDDMTVEVYETSESGNALKPINEFVTSENKLVITLNPEETFQTITGFGGSFTEASASLLNRLGKENKEKILQAYFGDKGAKYSLTRTHIASCDFSLSNYTYAKVENDMNLEHFTIEDDLNDLIPMILDAKKISSEGFNIIASPWTAPPWMKDNKHWVGGKLLPAYNDVFSLYFSKYLSAYKEKGIDIWGVTVINEPHGNGNNWESTHFSPKEMTDLVEFHLGPKLEKDGWGDVKIFGYDQNRAGLKEWVDEMYRDEKSSKYFAGTAIHWYESTYDYFPEALQYAHKKAPNKYLIETEGCIDAEVPVWQDDKWYWKKEATDWGWDWASAKDKHLHPKYAPVNRYATDIIGCLNNHVDGWVDWNMVLDKQGGPNWFKNWCIAPVIVDPEKDEVYFTPLYYVMAHFSKFMRPGAVRIGVSFELAARKKNASDIKPTKSKQGAPEKMEVTAVKNPDGSIAVAVFNPNNDTYTIEFKLKNKTKMLSISPKALQTIIIKQP